MQALQTLFSLRMRRFCFRYYIISIPPGAGAAGVFSFILATTDSVVNKVDATLFAFCNALLVTLVGSRIPASIMSTYSSL